MPGIDFLVPAPGTIDTLVKLVLGALVLFEKRYHLAHILARIVPCDQHRVGRFNHHDIFESEHGDKALLGANIAAAHAIGEDIAAQDVAFSILLGHLPQRLPRSHIAPRERGWRHCCHAGLFHHRHIEGNRRCAAKGIGVKAKEIKVGTAVIERITCGGKHIRRMAL